MIPNLLAQLEHVDVDGLLRTLLGAGGGAMLAGLIVRQWALGRIRVLAALEAKAKRDVVRWRLLARYMKSQAVEANRQRRNAHQLRSVLTSVLFALELLGEATHVKVRLPTREEMEWEPGQLEPLDLQLTDDGGADEEKGEA